MSFSDHRKDRDHCGILAAPRAEPCLNPQRGEQVHFAPLAACQMAGFLPRVSRCQMPTASGAIGPSRAAPKRYAKRRTGDDRMSHHSASVRWQRGTDEFLRGRYSRAHTWVFDGGATVPASASPAVVRAPWSDPAGVDPEEAFVAAVASCHMLWFLSLAADRGFLVEHYDDDVIGTMAPNADGRESITEVVLRPRIAFGGEKRPDAHEIEALHEKAHAHCFIANSVRSAIRIEPRP
jgi:organic hydroperoxide reductase OsmC/OhrA